MGSSFLTVPSMPGTRPQIWSSEESSAHAGPVPSNNLPVMGTWTGTATCTFITSSGDPASVSSSLTIRILTGGNVSLAEFDSTLFGAGGAGGLCGSNIAKAGETTKGSATYGMPTYLADDAVFDPDLPVASILFKVKLFDEKNGISGKLEGSGPLFPFHAGYNGTCKIKASRTSTATPTIDFGLFQQCFPI